MKELKIGVIGAGYWGPNLIRNIVESPNAQVVMVADKREDRRQHILERFPDIVTTADHQHLYDLGLDAVVVATPPETHFKLAHEALNNNLHVLVEKPLALNGEHAEQLILTAAQRDLVLMVGHTFEYNMAVWKLKELIDSGELGNIFYLDSRRVNLGLFQQNLNVLWDLAPHDISIFLYLLGEFPTHVAAQGMDCVFPGKHDVVFVHLYFPSGIMAHTHVSWLDPNKERRMTIVGDEKMLVFDDVDMLDKIKVYDKGVEVPKYTDTFGDFHCSYRFGNIVTPYFDFEEPLRIETEHFYDCIRKGTTPLSDGISGLRVINVLEAAEESLQNGGKRTAVQSPNDLIQRLHIPNDLNHHQQIEEG